MSLSCLNLRRIGIFAQASESALYEAVFYGHTHIVRVLLERGWTVSASCTRHTPCLHEAASAGHSKLVALLLDAGADIEGCDFRLDTALTVAVGKGHIHTAELLCSRGASLVSGSRNVLTAAVDSGSQECFAAMLQKGISVDSRDRTGHTALSAAIAWCSEDRVAFVLNSGASITCSGKKDLLPLSCAVGRGFAWGAQELLRRGADVNARSSSGRTALHASVEGVCPEDMVSFLIQAGADVNVSDGEGVTPLALCVAKHQGRVAWTIAERLIGAGASVNVSVKEIPVLLLAAEKADWPTLVALLAGGADPNVRHRVSGNTALHVLCKANYHLPCHKNAVAVLLLAGADHAMLNLIGQTPAGQKFLSPRNEFGMEIAGQLLAFGAQLDASIFAKAQTCARRLSRVLRKSLLAENVCVEAEGPALSRLRKVEALFLAEKRGFASVVQLFLEAPAREMATMSDAIFARGMRGMVRRLALAMKLEVFATEAIAEATEKTIAAIQTTQMCSKGSRALDIAQYAAAKCILARQKIIETLRAVQEEISVLPRWQSFEQHLSSAQLHTVGEGV